MASSAGLKRDRDLTDIESGQKKEKKEKSKKDKKTKQKKDKKSKESDKKHKSKKDITSKLSYSAIDSESKELKSHKSDKKISNKDKKSKKFKEKSPIDEILNIPKKLAQISQAAPKVKADNENDLTSKKNPVWNDWSQSSFGGDAGRKEKFLRLMGSKKSNEPPTCKSRLFGTFNSSTSAQKNTSELSDQTQKKIYKDLENQFEMGLELNKRFKSGSKKGLGA